MTGKRDLERTYRGLSTRERAVAEWEAWRVGRKPDPAIRRSIPDAQIFTFNHYLDRLATIDATARALTLAIHHQVAEAEAWAAALSAFWVTANRLEPLWALLMHLPEPITQTDYAARRASAREGRLTLLEAAELLAEREWTEGNDDAWECAVEDARHKMVEAARRKALPVAGRGRARHCTVGAFYDWLQEETPVEPERGLRYAVRPDEEAEAVAAEESARARGWETLDLLDSALMPGSLADEAEPEAPGEVLPAFGFRAKMRFRSGVHQTWQQLRVVEREAETLAAELGCADVLAPQVREALAGSRVRLEELASGPLREAIGALPEPEEVLQAVLSPLFRPKEP